MEAGKYKRAASPDAALAVSKEDSLIYLSKPQRLYLYKLENLLDQRVTAPRGLKL